MFHGHHHNHTPSHPSSGELAASSKKIAFAMVLVGFFMFVEFATGIMAHSLALVADAGHMLSDLAALFLTWIALRISQRPASTRFSYGSHRVQMLVAFINGLTMLAVAGWVIFEAIMRLFSPLVVAGWPVLIVAALGGIINIYTLAMLHTDSNFAVRSAVLHIIWDLFGSIGTLVAAILILLTGRQWIDPLLSVALSFLLLKSTWHIIRDSGHVLMEGAPQHIDVEELKKDLTATIPNVENVHHVHVWSLTHDYAILTLHVRLKQNEQHEEILHHVTHYLKTKYGFYHTTVQIEAGSCVDDEEIKCI